MPDVPVFFCDRCDGDSNTVLCHNCRMQAAHEIARERLPEIHQARMWTMCYTCLRKGLKEPP